MINCQNVFPLHLWIKQNACSSYYWLPSKCVGPSPSSKRKKRKVWRCWSVGGRQQQQIWDVTRGAFMCGKWFGDSHAPHVSFSPSPHPYIYHPCSSFWAQWFSHQITDFRGKKESIKVTSSHGGHHLSLIPLVQPETWVPPCSPLGCPT